MRAPPSQYHVPPSIPLSLMDRLEEFSFRYLTGRNLVYNTCWEDPAVDLQAMKLGSGDRVLVITSAGCNALDYALESPERIVAVDSNPRQTALLELKISAIRHLTYEDMFAIFGLGWHRDFEALYHRHLRADLSPFSQHFWDRRTHWFTSPSANFFTHGLTGLVAQSFQKRLHPESALGRSVRKLFDQPDIESQRQLYLNEVQQKFWTPIVKWFLSTQLFLSLVGVPMPQRRLLLGNQPDKMSVLIQAMVDDLFCTVPARDNYFWRVYVFGQYHPDCCPRYLTASGFNRLKDGLIDRIETHSCTITEYLETSGPTFTHAILLDHMDWMSSYYPQALQAEWNALRVRMIPGGRILFRSAHASPPYLDTITIGSDGLTLRNWLSFRETEAFEFSRADRVHTYTSFHIADVPTN